MGKIDAAESMHTRCPHHMSPDLSDIELQYALARIEHGISYKNPRKDYQICV